MKKNSMEKYFMKTFASWLVFLALLCLEQNASAQITNKVNWADWTSGTAGASGSAAGVFNTASGPVTISYSGEIAFIQTNGGTYYWTGSPSPYVSALVDSAPQTTDIIALSSASSKTLTFSEAVNDVFFAVISLNGNGYKFNRDFEIISYGLGYWGNGTLSKVDLGGGIFQLNGTGEPHGVIRFIGAVSSITWTSLTNEYWNGFTVGTYGVSVPPPTITSFAPTSGPIGTLVTITGMHFNAVPTKNVVRFGAVVAPVLGGDTTFLTVNVPVGATYAPISVTDSARALTQYSNLSFDVTFPSAQYIDVKSFAARVDFNTGSTPAGMAIGDVDGDGKPDIVTANNFGNSISVFRNMSTIGSITAASFPTRIDSLAGIGPDGLAFGDVDGDGKPDIVVANYSGSSVSVFRNTSSVGNISFQTKVNFATVIYPQVVVISDIDGDGKPDLVVNSYTGISILRNNSVPDTITSGSFAAKVDFAASLGSINPLGVADLDGDGKPDIVVGSGAVNSPITIFRNTSTIGAINSGSLASGVDFSTGGAGTLYECSIADLDDDGLPDIAVAKNNANVIVLRNASSVGSLAFDTHVDFGAANSPYGVAVADIDGDGKPDMAVPNRSGNSVSVFRNIGSAGSITNGSFAAKVDIATTSCPNNATLGDLDGDGKPDLVVSSDCLSILMVFRNVVSPPPPTSLTAAASTTVDKGIDVSWTASPSGAVANYFIYRSTSTIADTTGKRIAIVGTVTNYADITPSYGVFYYRVFARDLFGILSPSSNEVSSGSADRIAPNAPQNLAATAGNSQVSLKWNKNTESDFKRYRIYQNTLPNASIQIDSTSGGVTDTTRIITGLTGGTTYYFRVTAVDTSKNFSAYSNEVNAAPLDQIPPAAPQNLTATAGNAQITLKWNKNTESDFKRYRIYRSTSPNASVQIDSTTAGITDTAGTYTGLTIGTIYYFRVAAVDDSSNVSSYSNEVSAAPLDLTPPSAPVNLTAIAGNSQITLKWNQNSESDFKRYRIYRSTSPNATIQIDSTSGGVTDTTKIITGLTGGTTYYFRVTAVDTSKNFSAYSNEVNVDNTAPAIFYGLLASDVVNKVRIVAGANEALSSLTVTVNTQSVTMVKEGDAYFNNYTLGSSANLDLDITATDVAGNPANTTKSYHVTLLNKVNIFGSYSFSGTAPEGYLLLSAHEKAVTPNKWNLVNQPVEMLATASGGEMTVHASYDNKSVSSLAGYAEGKIGVYQWINDQWVYAGGQGKNGAVMSKLNGNYPVGVFYNPDHVVIPENFELHANYPNPFNPSTVISYQLSVNSKVSLKIYNILGQEVRALVNGEQQSAGFKDVVWDGKDAANHAVASGVYLYRLQAGNFVRTRKMMLIK